MIQRKSILMEVATLIVSKMLICLQPYPTQSSNLAKQFPAADMVYAYSCEVLSFGWLFLEFKDAIRHRDGDRDLIYFSLLFKASK